MTGRKKRLVHVATISHRHGTNTYVSRTKRGLWAELYDYVEEWWGGEISSEEFPKRLGKTSAVTRYFELVGHESLDMSFHVELDRERQDEENQMPRMRA